MTEQDFFPTNQTQFASERPLFQRPEDPYIDPTLSSLPKKSFLQRKRGIVILVAAISLVLVIVLLFLLSLMQPEKPLVTQEKVQETASEQAEISPLQAKYLELKAFQQETDPTLQILPYPQIDENISVDQVKEE
ncbi:MAG: hypothetical protein ACOZAN_00355 [Patescibacteria group bacterium]